MGADEMGLAIERDGAEAGDVALDAAHVGHERVGCEVRGDQAREGHDLVHRCGDHDEACAFGGVGG